jgi:uridine kinase
LSRRSLRGLFGLRVYINCSSRTRLRRRLARDRAKRGRTKASIREQFHATVEPMHQKYVAPQKQYANFVVQEEFGIRELYQLKSAIKTLRERRPAQPQGLRWASKKSFRRGH